MTAASRTAAIACDRLLGEEEIVVKTLGPCSRHIPGYLGGAILGDGRLALLLEPGVLDQAAATRRASHCAAPPTRASRAEDPRRRGLLDRPRTPAEHPEAAGYRVVTARDGRDGLEQLLGDDDFDLVLTDVEETPQMSGFELTEAIRASDERMRRHPS